MRTTGHVYRRVRQYVIESYEPGCQADGLQLLVDVSRCSLWPLASHLSLPFALRRALVDSLLLLCSELRFDWFFRSVNLAACRCRCSALPSYLTTVFCLGNKSLWVLGAFPSHPPHILSHPTPWPILFHPIHLIPSVPFPFPAAGAPPRQGGAVLPVSALAYTPAAAVVHFT